MIDQFENSAVPFTNELAQQIKSQIQNELSNLNGNTENMEGYNRAKFLLSANKLTGLELKRLKNYIDSMPKSNDGTITNPAYKLIGGNNLAVFIDKEIARLRHRINTSEKNKEELGSPKKDDVKPPPEPDLEGVTGLPRMDLLLKEEINKIKKLILF